jgi:UDP-glucose 4-epimerase
LVFSSSCTVYGEPDEIPVKESTQTKMAESPYGATKQMGEIILKDNANWLNTQCLRYFNPIGAHESGFIGELPTRGAQQPHPLSYPNRSRNQERTHRIW